MIGRDGIGCEPASATTLAALRKSTAQGAIDRDAQVVAILTGHALKDTDFILKSQLQEIGNDEESRTHDTVRIFAFRSWPTIHYEIKVPASIANLGPGFDTLAVAVQLYLRLRVEKFRAAAGSSSCSWITSLAAKTASSGPSGCWPATTPGVAVFAGRGDSDIPDARRAGQQRRRDRRWTAAVRAVAGPVSQEAMLTAACAIESHPDNAAAALLGGLTSSCQLPMARCMPPRFPGRNR